MFTSCGFSVVFIFLHQSTFKKCLFYYFYLPFWQALLHLLRIRHTQHWGALLWKFFLFTESLRLWPCSYNSVLYLCPSLMNFFFLCSILCRNCCWELILLVPPCEFQTWLQFTFMRSHTPDNRLGPRGMDCEFWATMWQSFGCHCVRASGEVTHMEMWRHLSSCGKECTAPSES